MKLIYCVAVLLLAALLPSLEAAKCKLTGVNLSGGEYGSPPGVHFHDYVYPANNIVDYFANKGMNTFRIPFLHERFQNYPGGPLITSELTKLDASVNYITNTLKKYVILDPHNYGRLFSGKLGESAAPISLFADFWGKFAAHYKSNTRVIFNLINEPNGQSAAIWWTASQVAVTAIRNAGATQLILVPGVSWTGAHSWISSGNAQYMAHVTDPANNMAFEVHQYLDSDSSGTHATCSGTTIGSTRMQAFTQWARQNGYKALLGEFGGGKDSTCLQAIDNIISFMENNDDVFLGWTYWAGGAWWRQDYFSLLQPGPDGADRPQWAKKHVNTAAVTLPIPAVPAKKTVPAITKKNAKYIYDDALIGYNTVYPLSATYSLTATASKKRGTNSISFTPSAFGLLKFRSTTNFKVGEYLTLDFWFNPGSSVASADYIHFSIPRSTIFIKNVVEGTLKANTWSLVHIPILRYGLTDTFSGFQIKNNGSAVPVMYFDDFVYVSYNNSIAAPTAPPTQAPSTIVTTVIYDDAIKDGFTIGSSFQAGQSLTSTSPKKSGSYSLKIQPTNYGALFLQCSPANCVQLNGNLTLEFWFNPGPTGTASRFNFNIINGNSKVTPTKSLSSLLPKVPAANEWVKAVVQLENIYPAGTYNGFHISGNLQTQVEPVFFDDIKLVRYPN